jgi:hypothetical protein
LVRRCSTQQTEANRLLLKIRERIDERGIYRRLGELDQLLKVEHFFGQLLLWLLRVNPLQM